MRLIFTLCILFIVSYSFAQFGDSCGIVQNKKDTTQSPIRIRIHCMRTVGFGDEPLYIVDGDPIPNNKLSDLRPENIDSVWILKGSVATAIYGSMGAYGVIVITTKSSKLRKFIIKDFLDGSRIIGATVSFISADKKDTLMLVSDDSGVVVTDKLKRSASYTMKVIAAGYKSTNNYVTNGYDYKGDIVLLTPKEMLSSESIKLKIYPNPIQKGSAVNLRISNDDGIAKTAWIISLEGKIIQQQILQANEGKNTFQLSTDPRWASGIYFLQIVCENGKILASDKIIIQ